MSTPADVAARNLVLDVQGHTKRARSLDTRISDSVIDGMLERTIDGASTLTLTVHDPKRVLLKSGIFDEQIDLRLDKNWFRLVQVSKRDDQITLTLEDREVARLRRATGPTKARSGVKVKPETANRGKVTRAEFALSLVRELMPAIPFVCPQLHTTQPIAGSSEKPKGKHDKRHAQRTLPYQYRRGAVDGRPESTWECLRRLADEVQWRCFVNEGAIYFLSDDDLLARMGTRRLLLTESTLGIDAIDFDIDNGKVQSEVTVTARIPRWSFDPGTAVELRDVGPANGNDWLVQSTSRSLFDPSTNVVLKRRTKALKEPAAETETFTIGGGKTTKSGVTIAGFSTGGDTSAVEACYEAAVTITSKHFPYVYGGGHGACGVPTSAGGVGPGFDCSAAVCAVLAAGGLGFTLGGPVMASTALMSWGVAGPGKYISVYAKPGGTTGHAFIVFHTTKGDQHFGTGDWGKGWNGAGLNPRLHPTSGFTVRHWPGT